MTNRRWALGESQSRDVCRGLMWDLSYSSVDVVRVLRGLSRITTTSQVRCGSRLLFRQSREKTEPTKSLRSKIGGLEYPRLPVTERILLWRFVGGAVCSRYRVEVVKTSRSKVGEATRDPMVRRLGGQVTLDCPRSRDEVVDVICVNWPGTNEGKNLLVSVVTR